MEWTTHCLSGMAAGHMVTGGDWRAALVGGLAGVIPDLDDHKSKVGKVLLPFAYFLNKTFGHRTITHSLLFAFSTGIILCSFTDPWIWLAAFAGIVAHSLGDMLTGKVMFFYPAQKSFGISTSPLMFNIIDRSTAIILLVYIGRETLMILI